MRRKMFWPYTILLIGIVLVTTATATLPLRKVEPDCSVSPGQTVVKWKDMYWFPCNYSWKGYCLWPIRRRHSTYKVTLTENIPMRDEKGEVIIIANGERMNWTVYDSTDWNELVSYPDEKNRYVDYEPIAENEYVVLVQTRYRWFHDVEATLRICTQKN